MATTNPSSGALGAIGKKLNDNNGFTVVTLEDLKQLIGVGRLGKNVLADMADLLRRNRVGYFPRATLDDNPYPRASQELRLYRDDLGNALAGVINAVVDPGPNGDDTLRALLDSDAQRVEALRANIKRALAALEDAMTELKGDEEPDDR